MSSDRFAQGHIGSLYFTSDGLVTGSPCKLTVEGEEQFASDYAAQNIVAADSTVHSQIINTGAKGREFALRFEYVPEAVMTSLTAILNTALSSGTPFTLVIDSFIDFTVDAMPVLQGGALFTYEKRSGGILQNARVSLIAVG